MVNRLISFLKKYKYFFVGFIILFFVSLLFPYSGDDWTWSTYKLNFHTIIGFYNDGSLNGRYLGNTMAIILCRNVFLRGIIISLIINSIIMLINKETKTSSLLVWLMLLTIPIEILNQTIIWSAGFGNYVVSTFMLLINLLFLRGVFQNKINNIFWTIMYIPIAWISCLIIENLTIYFVIFGVALNVIYYLKNKKININLLILTFVYILGAITMFFHPAYLNLAKSGSDGYRSFGKNITDILRNMILNGNVIQRCLVRDNFAVIMFLLILSFVYYKNNKNKFSKKVIKFLNWLFYFSFLYEVYALLYNLTPNWQTSDLIFKFFNLGTAFLNFVSIAIIIYLLFKESNNYYNMLFIIITIIILVMPLFIVTPIGPRNFFMTYILEIILVSYIFSETKKYLKFNEKPLLIGSVILLTSYYVVTYAQIIKAYYERQNYIIDKVNDGEKEIVVPSLPNGDYVWVPNFYGEYNAKYYKLSIGVPKDIKFNFVSYNEWKEKVK